MKREVKTRPVDVWRKLPLVASLEDPRAQGDGDDGIERGGSTYSRVDSSTGLVRSESSAAIGGLAKAQLAPALLPMKKQQEIPVPVVQNVEDYEKTVDASFKLPESYIRTKKVQLLAPGMEADVLEYNLEVEDEEWLANHRIIGPKGDMAGALEADRFERMIDELEKATGANEAISLLDTEIVLENRMGMQAIGSNKTVIAEVHGYWVAKRQRLKKALLRKYWSVTSINDTNPHLVFRPREKERYKLRKHRKNDADAYRRLQTLRRDFAHVQNLMALVKKREQVKLTQLKLQEEQYLQSIAEMCGQQRKPKIPKDMPVREELKLKIRVRPGVPLPTDDRPRKKRHRDELEERLASEASRRPQPPEINPDQDRLRNTVGCGFKEKDGSLPCPDYIPSFMEELRIRQVGRVPPRRLMPYADDSTTYAWRPSTKGRGGRIGHIRSGICSAPRCPPIDFEGEEAAASKTVCYRSRARIGRGGRLVFDRIPVVTATGPSAYDAALDAEDIAPSYGPIPSDLNVILSAPQEVPNLEKYPTMDLLTSDVFKYPSRYREISDLMEDNEEEVLEFNAQAPSDPDPLLTLPPRPKPPETDAVCVLRFELRV